MAHAIVIHWRSSCNGTASARNQKVTAVKSARNRRRALALSSIEGVATNRADTMRRATTETAAMEIGRRPTASLPRAFVHVAHRGRNITGPESADVIQGRNRDFHFSNGTIIGRSRK